jgi:putative copper resistance protein D
LSRAFHFAACLVIVATLVVDRIVVAPTAGIAAQRWRPIARWLLLLALPAALMSGIAWFSAIAADMSGLPPAQALQRPILQLVWTKTHFGGLWELRLVLWAATAVFSLARYSARLSTPATWLALLCGSALSVSLAWAGHGLFGNPVGWHLLADGTHLLIAGFWPAGLLPFALLFSRLYRVASPEQRVCVITLTRRFSAMSLASVALLAVTGLANSWFLVGPPSNLWRTGYGRVLLGKIALFAIMVGIGAINLLRLKPRVSDETAAAQLRFNVRAEALLGAGVVILVAVLGLLQPACCQ